MDAPLFRLHPDTGTLDRLRAGDEEALVALYRSSRRQIASYVLRNSGTMDDAEDVLQEALAVLWERVRADRFDFSARVETFLYATARNIWLRRLARARREPAGRVDPDGEASADPSSLDALIESDEAALLREAMDRLGEPCRTLLVLYYWEERSMEEIAAALGFANADTAKSKKYQCKKALRLLLGERMNGHGHA